MKLESLKTLKKAFWIVLVLMVLFAMFKIFTRLTFLNWFYTPLLTLLTEKFGPATAITKITALVGSLLALMILPTIITIVIWGKKKKEVFIYLSVVFLFLCTILFYESKTIFFDSSTGEAIKYYCITLDGVKFSNNSGVDQVSGIEFQPITKDLIKKYQIWQKHQKNEQVSYFDTATGEPNFKYGEDSDKNIILYPTLYEFDPTTGEKLNFVNVEIISRYSKKVSDKFHIKKISKKLWEVSFYTDEPVRVMDVWSAGTTIYFSGPTKDEVILQLDPAGGGGMFPLPVGYHITNHVGSPLVLQYKTGGKIFLNFN